MSDYLWKVSELNTADLSFSSIWYGVKCMDVKNWWRLQKGSYFKMKWLILDSVSAVRIKALDLIRVSSMLGYFEFSCIQSQYNVYTDMWLGIVFE